MPDASRASDDRPSDDRPRDDAGRAHNDRPRDSLGRPLPRGAAGVPRQPEGVRRTPEQTLAVAQTLLEQRLPFHAHDVFEDHWKQTVGHERNLWRALAQLAVGVTHAARGNQSGARTVLERAAGNLQPYAAAPPHQIRVSELCLWARGSAAGLDPESDAPIWLDVPALATR